MNMPKKYLGENIGLPMFLLGLYQKKVVNVAESRQIPHFSNGYNEKLLLDFIGQII